MKRKNVYILAVFLITLFLALYAVKIATFREKFSFKVDNNIHCELTIEPDLFGFIDIPAEKKLQIYNKRTKAKLSIDYTSGDYNVFFYRKIITKENKTRDVIILGEQQTGYTMFDYNTFNLMENTTNWFYNHGSLEDYEASFKYANDTPLFAFIYSNKSKKKIK